MKNKILTLLIIAIFIVSIMSVNSFAKITSGTVSLTASKSSYNLDDENEIITVTLKLSNLKSNNGIIAYSGVLEYDKSKLTYLDRAGAGLWAPPSYSDENGRLIADRADNDFSGGEEVLCTFRFKPKAAGDNIVIKLSNIELSSGDIAIRPDESPTTKINDAQVSINIKSATQPSNPGDDNKPSNPGDDNKPSNPGSDDNNNDNGNNNGDNNNNQDNGNSGSGTDSGSNENGDGKTDKQNNSQKDDSNPNKSNSIIPKLGTSTYVLIVIGIALVIAIIFFVRMKLLDRKIKRRHRRR